MQTPVYKLKTKRQQITLANKAIQEWTRNGITDGQSVIIGHNMYNNACSIAHSKGACSVNKEYIKKKKKNIYTLCDIYTVIYVHCVIYTLWYIYIHTVWYIYIYVYTLCD